MDIKEGNNMTVLEILEKRKALYERDIEKKCFTREVIDDTKSRIRELDNLIFIITTQNIDGIQ